MAEEAPPLWTLMTDREIGVTENRHVGGRGDAGRGDRLVPGFELMGQRAQRKDMNRHPGGYQDQEDPDPHDVRSKTS